jgi:NMD protein affecting ribosome stability and mRNA decay
MVKTTLKSKFCAKCGSNPETLTDNLCPECYFEIHAVKVPRQKVLKVCSKCDSALVGRFWVGLISEKRAILAEQIRQVIKLPDYIKIIKVDPVKIKPDGLIEITYDVNGTIISKEYKSNMSLDKQICPACKENLDIKTRAKMQFRTRGDVVEFTEQVIDFMRSYKKSVVKIKEYKTGVDIYVKNRIMSLRIAREFKQKYKCHMKESREEYSWDRANNRPKYKSTIRLLKK